MTEEQVNKKLVDDYGYDAEDIAEVAKRVDIITKAQASGMNLADIKQKMEGREVTADTTKSEPAPRSQAAGYWSGMPSGASPKKDKFVNLVDDANDMNAEELVSS